MRHLSILLSLIVLGQTGSFVFPEVSEARLATNRLATNRLATNRLATNRLATNRLSTNGLSADMESSGDLLATADGREVYAYLVSCALPFDVTISATIAGAPDSGPADPPPNDTIYTCRSEVCTFDGGMGLAPKWIDRKLNKKGQRWISACMFARVNVYTQAQGISLRGNHDGLVASVGEQEQFPLEEGAFYGQLFTEPEEPIQWYACIGEDQAADDTGGLALRDCAEPDPDDPTHTRCGFIFTGPCADFDAGTVDPYACKTFEDGVYGKCHERPGAGKWPQTKKYKEVITTFTAN